MKKSYIKPTAEVVLLTFEGMVAESIDVNTGDAGGDDQGAGRRGWDSSSWDGLDEEKDLL